MTIIFTANPKDSIGFAARCFEHSRVAIRVDHARDFINYPEAELYIDTLFDGFFASVKGPLLFNSTAFSFAQLPKAPGNSGRFCAWPGFFERDLWEIALKDPAFTMISALLASIGIQAKMVPDIAGLIAPRILCTIINEAAITLFDGIASSSDIDTAMKLGTNYPLGPLEWAKSIGIDAVREVLIEKEKEDNHLTELPNFYWLEVLKK